MILTVDNITVYDEITTSSSALACSILENGVIVVILQSLVCGFNPAHVRDGIFYSGGKAILGKPAVSRRRRRAQKWCQLGESPSDTQFWKTFVFTCSVRQCTVWQLRSPNTPVSRPSLQSNSCGD